MLGNMLKIVLSLLLVFSGCQSVAAVEGYFRVDEAATWAGRMYDRCLEQLFERPEVSGALQGPIDTAITIRSTGAYQSEVQVSVAKTKSGQFEVQQIEIRPSLEEQLTELFPGTGSEIEDDFCQRVQHTVQKATVEDDSLDRLFAKIQRMEVPVVPSSEIELDGAFYSVWITSAINRSHFQLQGSATVSDREQKPHPLVEWSREVLRIVPKLLANSK